MEWINWLTMAFSVLSFVMVIVVFVIVMKNRKTGDVRLGGDDLKQIRTAVNESVNALGSAISTLVAEKNSVLMSDLSVKVEKMNDKIDILVHSEAGLEKAEETFKTNITKLMNDNKDEMINNFNGFATAFTRENDTNKDKLISIINDNYQKLEKEFSQFVTNYTRDSNAQKTEIMDKLSAEINSFNDVVRKTLTDFDSSIKERLEDFKNNTQVSIKELNDTVSSNLDKIRTDNNEKLDSINQSVNEKLQKTLEEKLNDSFKSVVQGIGDVNKAVGEIKGIATDVGSLKNVLTNVKTKGIMGEVILGNIIREFLTAGQYEENVATKKVSTERVEYAIILPGTKDSKIYLPVDSKFPYKNYVTIHDSTDSREVEEAKKQLKTELLKYAKDVHDKYIDVPNTTDFAVIFLPLEGLYLEALNMGLFEEIQSKYKVNLTGPTTFSAFVNSLNMGFKSLLIQKKSADVFKLLGAVKTEFGKFADALQKTQKKVDDASVELEKLVGTRTRAMNKKLNTIDALDEETTKLVFGESTDFSETDEEE